MLRARSKREPCLTKRPFCCALYSGQGKNNYSLVMGVSNQLQWWYLRTPKRGCAPRDRQNRYLLLSGFWLAAWWEVALPPDSAPATSADSDSCITSICFLESHDKSSATASQLTIIEGIPQLFYVDASFRRVVIIDLGCSKQTLALSGGSNLPMVGIPLESYSQRL